MGAKAYRFSIAWRGCFRRNVSADPQCPLLLRPPVDELLQVGIEPYSPSIHWDLPQGSRTKSVAGDTAKLEAFGDYAGHVAARPAIASIDLTINEAGDSEFRLGWGVAPPASTADELNQVRHHEALGAWPRRVGDPRHGRAGTR